MRDEPGSSESSGTGQCHIDMLSEASWHGMPAAKYTLAQAGERRLKGQEHLFPSSITQHHYAATITARPQDPSILFPATPSPPRVQGQQPSLVEVVENKRGVEIT